MAKGSFENGALLEFEKRTYLIASDRVAFKSWDFG
jgi:hypothetical protein